MGDRRAELGRRRLERPGRRGDACVGRSVRHGRCAAPGCDGTHMRITLRCETRAARALSTLLIAPAYRLGAPLAVRRHCLLASAVAQEAMLATTARIAAEADVLRLNEGSGPTAPLHTCTRATMACAPKFFRRGCRCVQRARRFALSMQCKTGSRDRTRRCRWLRALSSASATFCRCAQATVWAGPLPNAVLSCALPYEHV